MLGRKLGNLQARTLRNRFTQQQSRLPRWKTNSKKNNEAIAKLCQK